MVANVIYIFFSSFIFSGCQSALEGRAVVNLQMGNTFGAFVDMNEAIKVQDCKLAALSYNLLLTQILVGND